jgi:hypothetical protein
MFQEVIGKYIVGKELIGISHECCLVSAATDMDDHSQWAIHRLLGSDLIDLGITLSDMHQRIVNLSTELVHEGILRIQEIIFLKDRHSLYVITELIQEFQFDTTMEEDRARDAFAHMLSGVFHARTLGYGVESSLFHLEHLVLDHALNVKISPLEAWAYGLHGILPTTQWDLLYASPEMVNCDDDMDTGPSTIWSLGIILYLLLSNRNVYPFYSSHRSLIRGMIARGTYKELPHVSQDAQDLIRRIFVVDAATRITFPEALQHQWLSTDWNGPTCKDRHPVHVRCCVALTFSGALVLPWDVFFTTLALYTRTQFY